MHQAQDAEVSGRSHRRASCSTVARQPLNDAALSDFNVTFWRCPFCKAPGQRLHPASRVGEGGFKTPLAGLLPCSGRLLRGCAHLGGLRVVYTELHCW